jgi:hypothetical protein
LIVESVEDMMTLNLKCNLLENPLQVSGNKILLTFVKGEYKFNDFCICMASTLDGIENRRYDILYQRYSGNGGFSCLRYHQSICQPYGLGKRLFKKNGNHQPCKGLAVKQHIAFLRDFFEIAWSILLLFLEKGKCFFDKYLS